MSPTKAKTKTKSKPKPKPAARKPKRLAPKASAKAKPRAKAQKAAPAQKPSASDVFCWHELMTSDVAGAKAFYSSLFGWGHADMPMGPSTYTLWKVGGQDVGGLMGMPGGECGGQSIPPAWMIYVAVPDVDASAKKAVELGGKVCHGPMDIPGIGRFAVLEDPKGAVISVFKGASNPA